jgi:hypothetical protein
VVAVTEPQVIADGKYEQLLGRVNALDVAKASAMVCTHMPHEDQSGKHRTWVWQVDAAPAGS